jgi:hypothetical protein
VRRSSLGGFTAATAVAVTASLSLLVAGGAPASAAAAPHFKAPKVYGTQFQTDPHHDFTKGLSPRHDGILRGWVVYYHQGGVVEYKPIKWVRGRSGKDGHFTGPSEYDVTAYASRVSGKAVLYGATGCKTSGGRPTVDRRGLGTRLCSSKALLAHLKAGKIPALITVYHGLIVKIQEIGIPHVELQHPRQS